MKIKSKMKHVFAVMLAFVCIIMIIPAMKVEAASVTIK